MNIDFNWEKKPYKKNEVVTKFIFADDGIGMNPQVLHTCLRLGDSTNRTTSGKIGRFGVGGTNAAVSQAKRVEIYSKTKDGEWHYTFLDLDLMLQGENGENIEGGKGMPKPKKQSPPEWINVPSNSHGTIVIWDKVDNSRLDKGDLKKLDWMIGRTYRKFINDETIKNEKIIKNKSKITIKREGKTIFGHDPLFVTKNANFPDDECAKFTERIIQIPERNDPAKKHNVRIRISELPQSWWEEEGSGANSHTKDRFIHKNEGISIVRENREIFYGHLNFFKVNDRGQDRRSGFVEIDRWVGIEIDFDRSADIVFGVQNNKSRNQISTNAREVLQKALSPTITDFRRKFRRIRKSKRPSITPPPIINPNPGSDDPNILPPDFQNKIKEQYGERVAEELTKHSVSARYDLNLDPNGPFIKFNTEFGKLILTYNMSHPAMRELHDTMDSRDMDDGTKYTKIKNSLNVILASYGLAKNQLDLTKNDVVDDTLTTLMAQWSDMTSRIAKNTYKKD